VFAFDAGYDPIALTHELTDVAADLVVRIRDDRVFYTDPDPVEPGTVGRPCRHGDKVKLADPDTWPAPDLESTTTDSPYGTVRVSAWHGLHPKLGRRGHWADHDQPPIIRGTVVRVDVEHLPKPTSRTKKTLWLWAAGPSLDLDVWRAYLRRFDIEHTFRFVKNTLGWTTPSVRTPEQADRWTWLILAAYTQLRLARGQIEDLRLPWERRRDPGRLTPTRVRRGVSATCPSTGHTGQSAKIRHPRSRTTKRHPPSAAYPLPSDQEGRIARVIASSVSGLTFAQRMELFDPDAEYIAQRTKVATEPDVIVVVDDAGKIRHHEGAAIRDEA